MTAADWLARAHAATDGATSGPWEVSTRAGGSGSTVPVVQGGSHGHFGYDLEVRVQSPWPSDDLALIAASRTMLPAAVAAIEAVLDVTLAARLHPGSLRCQFAEDIEAAITAALDPS